MKNKIYFLILLPLIVFGKPSIKFNTYNNSNKFEASFLGTAPTSISGITSICIGSGTNLTAVGATLSSGDTYQWGTGTTIGSNKISGQNTATIAIAPTNTTTYWVRVVSASGVATNGVSVTVAVNTLDGDQSAYGNGNWIGYVYPNFTSTTNPPADAFSTAYRGSITTSGVNFDQDLGSGSISGTNLCGTYSDFFAIRYKTIINLAAGYYNFTVGADDGYKLKVINNGSIVSNSNDGNDANTILSSWTDQGYVTSSKTMYLSGSTKLILEYYEKNGASRVSFSYSPCAAPSVAPTSITGTTTVCSGSSTTLTANGATLNSGAVYQWGTGTTIGSNIITGQNSASISVTQTGYANYWVRVIDAAPCSNASVGIATLITFVNPSGAPTAITGLTSICLGSSTVLTASGGFGSPGSTYQWGTGTVVGSNIITGQTSSSITVAPIVNTNYWVRRIDNGTCTAATDGISTLVNVVIPAGDQTTYGTNSWIGYVYSDHNTTANPVVEDVFATNYRGYLTQNETFDLELPSCVISGATICGTYNVKYAVRFKMNKNFTPGYYNFLIGGDDGVRLSLDGGATYLINKWNVQAYTTGTATIYLSGNTNLVLEYFQGPLSNARVSFTYTTCSTSTAPTTIAGNTTTCSGSPTTLTATGGSEGVGSTYQWGTGTEIGSNIITGQTASSITVSPTNTTIYWVRRIGAAPCSLITSGITTTVTTTAPSTRPTWFSGVTPVCLGYGTTITANGGIAAPGSTYQWGTGTIVGSNIIIGQTAQTLTISPIITTTYWVRRLDSGICTAYTDGTTVLVTVAVPPGNPAVFGDNQWNVYGYSTGDITLATALYAGYYTLNSLNFDTQSGTNSWSSYASPSSATGWSGCTVPSDNFTYTLKRKGFPCGNYTLKLLNWDDQASVFINGTQVWSSPTWNGNSSATLSGVAIGTYNLDANSTVEVRVRDFTSSSNASLSFTKNNNYVLSSDPTLITGDNTIISGTSIILAASGGILSSTGSYQWGTGSTVGSNIIAGQTAASITVSPTTDTVYWVRRLDTSCNNITGGVTKLVSVNTSVGGNLSIAQNICSGTNASDIVLTGNVGNVVKWQKSNDSNFVNATDITSTATTLSSSTIGLLDTTTYFRAIVVSGTSPAAFSSVTSILINPASVGGTISGSSRICSGSNVSLLLSNKIGNVIKWQSSTVSDFSYNVSDLANTTSNLTTPNLTTTTYYRAVVQNGFCSPVNSSIVTITVDALSVGGTISGSTSVCPNVNSTNLTIAGQLGSVVKWQSSTSSDFLGNITDIASTSNTLVVTNLSVKTYYRAVVANGTCSNALSSRATIDIKPLLGTIGEITGPTSVCGLTSATYSISPVDNATNYIWTFPSGLSVYSSAGTSVVVNIDALFGNGVITVKATNGCQISLVKIITIIKTPKLSTINGPIATCGLTTGTYIANTLTGATYNWIVPAGISITSGQGTPTIQVSYNSNYVTGNIGVTATSSCGISDVLEYKVNNIQMSTGINGLAQIGSATSGTYTTPLVSGMGYVWSVPSGVTIVSGQSTNSVSLSFASAFTTGTISVAMISTCGTSIPRTFDISRNQPTIALNGPESLCGIAQITYNTVGTLINYTTLFATYTVPLLTDAVQYIWTVPQGASIASGQGTNSITMGFNNSTFVNGNVTITAMLQSGTVVTNSLAVKRVAGTISGTTNVCDLTTAIYNVPNTIGTNFSWIVPTWMTIVSGQGTNTITVSIGIPFANDVVKLNFLSNCNTYESFTLNVGCNKSTNIKDTQCGSILVNLDSSIYPNPIVGAQGYKYQVTNGTDVRVYEPTTILFNLTQLPGGVTYNTTYSVQVAVKLNGLWGGFGSPCNITTPLPITKVKVAFCGTTLSTIITSVYADALIGVQGYRFEVTDPTNNVRTFDATNNLFNLTQLIGGAAYNTTYSIRVAANVNGVWGTYGTSCMITTPSITPTKVIDSQCGTTLIALNSSVYYVTVYSAQAYRFEVTNGTSVVTYDLTNTANLFNLTQLVGGAAYTTTYSIRVASNVNGTWSTYGAACSITTPAAITKVKAQFCGTTLATLATSVYADALIGVQGYRFEVTNGTNVRTFDATSNLFNLTQLIGGAAYGTTYSIRVAVNVNGVWGTYGVSCNVTTPTKTTAKQNSEIAIIEFSLKAYPNPFTATFKFELTSNNEDSIEIKVYDMLGKMITNQTVDKANINTIELGNEYTTGVYNVIIRQGMETKTLRMIKR